jgi:hypothetical protein
MPKLCFRLPFLHCFNGRLCPSSLPPDERSRGHPQLGPSPADWTPSICAYENGKSNTCNAGKEFVYIVSCFDSCIELGRTCGSNKRTARSCGGPRVDWRIQSSEWMLRFSDHYNNIKQSFLLDKYTGNVSMYLPYLHFNTYICCLLIALCIYAVSILY